MSEMFSRRGFLGTTAGAVGAATAGAAATQAAYLPPATQAAYSPPAFAAAEPAPGEAPQDAKAEARKEGIRLGMQTAPFVYDPLEVALDFAKQLGVYCVEVAAEPGSQHFDPLTFGPAEADAVKKMLNDRGLEISSLANYTSPTEPDKTDELQALFLKIIDAAALLEVPTVCMITGMPAPRMTKINTIKKVLPKIFGPIIAHAGEKGVKIAVENFFETCLQGIDTFECLFETIPDDHFGLNYDPSHLYLQQCNHLLPLSQFAGRIFHTHAKDVLVDAEQRARLGIYSRDWWRYAIPGFGNINWGEYISHLRMNRYEGVLSIEHEDYAFDREEGFRHGARYLQQFC